MTLSWQEQLKGAPGLECACPHNPSFRGVVTAERGGQGGEARSHCQIFPRWTLPGASAATPARELTHPKEQLQRCSPTGPPGKNTNTPTGTAPSRPEPAAQDACPSFSLRNPPAAHTTDARRRLSDQRPPPDCSSPTLPQVVRRLPRRTVALAGLLVQALQADRLQVRGTEWSSCRGVRRRGHIAQRQRQRRVVPKQIHESANFLDAPPVAHDNPALATRIANGNSRAGLRRCAATNGGDDVDPGG